MRSTETRGLFGAASAPPFSDEVRLRPVSETPSACLNPPFAVTHADLKPQRP